MGLIGLPHQESAIKKRLFTTWVLTLVVTLACGLFPSNAQATTFENDRFNLTIPAGWNWGLGNGKDYFDLGLTEIVGLNKSSTSIGSNTYFTVASSPLAGGIDLQTRFNQAYEHSTTMQDVKKQAFQRGELSGYQIEYKRPYGESWYEWRDIWMANDGIIYVLSCRALRGKFGDSSSTFDQIVESF